MAKDRKKLQHIHSSVFDKQPTPATLELGELAVNNNKEGAFLSTKNSDGVVVRFSEDQTLIDWMELKGVIPYKGYVRGDGGTNTTTGDAPTPDGYGSYGITEEDLIRNTSNIVVKMNQVAAALTPYYDKVNNAKDRYGKEINPISTDGNKDGAGYSIDMSRYAMQGANPSFSSVTTTNNITVGGTLHPQNGLSKALSWTYSDVQSEANGSTNFKEDKTFKIPKCASHIGRGTVAFASGVFDNGVKSYDPGAKCDNTSVGTVYIPTSIDHLKEWNGFCFTIPHNLCVEGTVSAQNFFSSSDRNLKENIADLNFNEINKVRGVGLKSFNFKDDETKTKTYGVIAQDVQAAGLNELVHTSEDGHLSVDYISLLLLKIASLEYELTKLRTEVGTIKHSSK